MTHTRGDRHRPRSNVGGGAGQEEFRSSCDAVTRTRGITVSDTHQPNYSTT